MSLWRAATGENLDDLDATASSGSDAVNITNFELSPVVIESDLARAASLQVRTNDSLDALDDKTYPRCNAANVESAMILREQV